MSIARTEKKGDKFGSNPLGYSRSEENPFNPFSKTKTGLKRDRKSANPDLDPDTGVNTMLEKEGIRSFTEKTDEARAEHNEKWRAIRKQAKLTAGELSDVTSIVEPCNYDDIAELSKLLGDMRTKDESSMEMGGGGKMVGGNITAHFIRLQEWLTPKFARGAVAISNCARWFINKILAELSKIGGEAVALGGMTWSGLIDLTKYAMGADNTQTAQMILAICDGIGRAATTTGDTLGAIGTAVYRYSPYSTVFTDHINNLLTTQKELFVGKIPGVNNPDQFDAWLKTLTWRDVMSAVATMIAAGKWAAVGFGGAKLTIGILLTTGYYGILAAAWSMDGYVLTGAWLTYYGYNSLDDESWIKQGVVNLKQEVVSALKYIDNVIAGKIAIDDRAMKQVAVLNKEPKARALVLARLDNKMVQAKLGREEAFAGLTHEQAVKEKLKDIGLISVETDRLVEATLEIQMSNRIMEERLEKRASGTTTTTNEEFNPIVEIDTPIAGSEGVNINTADSQTMAKAAGGGPGATPGATGSGFGTTSAQQKMGAQPKMDQSKMDQSMDHSDSDFEVGGKRATRKRGKRSSKRGSRKTKTTRKKTTRKKRRGKK